MVRGWVYVISNKAMPRLVKVGFSERDPINRASELAAGTEVPFRYELIYDALVYSPYEVEQRTHLLLDDARAGKEWFECDWIAAVSAIRSVATDFSTLLAEKEYELLTEYRTQVRLAQEQKEREAREQLLREQRAIEDAIRERDARAKQAALAKALAASRIVVCPKCHSTVKTSGKPPPYFCIACGHSFATGL